MADSSQNYWQESLARTRSSLNEALQLKQTSDQRIEKIKKDIEDLTAQLQAERAMGEQIHALLETITKTLKDIEDAQVYFSSLSTEKIASVDSEQADTRPLLAIKTRDTAGNLGGAFNPKKEDIARATREIIESVGHPVLRADLYKLLLNRGIRIYGRDPHMVLSTMLWRAGEDQGIINLKGHGYWLRDRDFPELEYKAPSILD